MLGQLYPRVWPILPQAGQPHFNSVINLRGHKCNFLFFFFLIGAPETMMRLKLKEHVYKHTCIIFVILFDDKEGEYKKNHVDLGWIQTAPRGTTQSKSLPSWGICKGFLIPEACGDGLTGMLVLS